MTVFRGEAPSGGGGGGGSAATVTFAPTGSLGAGNVQDALAEVAAEGVATWASGRAYTPGDHVNASDRLYRCVTGHTAGATFAGDAANWQALRAVAAGADGNVQFNDGTGSLSGEVAFTYNATTDTLSVPKLLINETIRRGGVVTVPTLTADANNLDPFSGLLVGSVWVLSASAQWVITGLIAQPDGATLDLVNPSANPVILRGSSASSTAANRFAWAGDRTLNTGEGITLMYSASAARWLSMGPVSTTASVGPVLTLPATATPGAPVAGNLSIWAGTLADRAMLQMRNPAGTTNLLQPFLGRNKAGIWLAPGGSVATVPGVFGYPAVTASGTITARIAASTNYYTRSRRVGYVSAATAGSFAGVRVAATTISTGTGSLGGFMKVCRFGISDAALVTDARTFVGVSLSVSAPTNVEPNTLTNVIGVGHGAADTTLSIYYGAGVAQTPISLGANFPSNTVSTDMYELVLYCPPTGGCTYQVTRLNTGDTASGVLSAGSIPASTSLLSQWNAWRCNNATAAAVGLDFVGDYIETFDS